MLDPDIFTSDIPPTPTERLADWRRKFHQWLLDEWHKRLKEDDEPEDNDG